MEEEKEEEEEAEAVPEVEAEVEVEEGEEEEDLGIWREINSNFISLHHWSCVVFGEFIVYLHFLCVLHLQYSVQ